MEANRNPARLNLEERTKKFAVQVVRLVELLPNSQSSTVLGKQLLRSATAIGANYRSASRARSKPDFISKIGIAEEEADEARYWLELLSELKMIPESSFISLHEEAGQLTAIFVASGRTAKYGRR
ncbi:MAG: four helix bundle protein [Bacteroidota bacterium]